VNLTTLPPSPPTPLPPGGFQVRFHVRMLGTPAPVFPGFEVDYAEASPESEKQDAEWHHDRVRGMLAAHPEIRELIGQDLWTALWCVVFAGLQIGLAVGLASQPVWLILVVAYAFGTLINMNLFMLAHECNHSLVFRSPTANRWLFTLTTLPMFLSAHHAWWIEHHVHHSDLGAKKDFIKRRRTFFLLTRYTTPLFIPYALFMLIAQVVRSAIGLLVYAAGLLRGQWKPGPRALAVLADVHLVSGYQKYRMPFWAVAYSVLSLALPATLWWACGWKAVFYLLMSQTFTTGFLHPLMFGMILSNSHFHGADLYQPTSSYYGWLNWITFNFGYHTEHHDLASIPWSRLPALRRLAPEFYDHLHQTPSYVGLALQFVFRMHQFKGYFDAEERKNAEMLARLASAGGGDTRMRSTS
jgi:sphingolipid delta-4 desaturase